MRTPTLVRTIVPAALVVVALFAGGVASAAPRTTSYSLRGYDPAWTAIPGGYVLDGAAWGDLLEGTGTVTVTADDGSLPAERECEPATVLVDVGPTAADRLFLEGHGDLCRMWNHYTLFGASEVTGKTGRWLSHAQGGGFVSLRVDPWGSALWTTDGELRGIVRPLPDRPAPRPTDAA